MQGGAEEVERRGTTSTSQSRFALDSTTHVIAMSEDFAEYRFCTEPSAHDGAQTDRPIAVTPQWVRRSAQLGLLQKERHFSCLSSMIFSGLCVAALASKMARADREVIGNVVPAYGGVWREDVYGDVNVLLTTTLDSKRITAFLKLNGANLVLAAPNWINDSWRARRLLPLDKYRFDPTTGQVPPCLASASASPSAARSSPSIDKTVFKNKCILLSRDIGRASEQQLRSLEHFIRSSGGTVRRAPSELKGITQAVRNSDYIVCRFRDVQEYREAIRQKKTVANLAWLIAVISNDALTDPKDEPLHYPVPRAAIPDFQGLAVTVTSYRGEQRAYIVKLIKLLGATFDGTLTRDTGLCVAANMQSEKTLKARDWSVPIVNHRYIVDCFLAWTALERDNLKYIDFPDGVDYGAEVGSAKVTDESLGPWIHDALEADEPSDLPASESGLHPSSTCIVPSSTNENSVQPIRHDGVPAHQRPALTEIDASVMNQDTPTKTAPRKRVASEQLDEEPAAKHASGESHRRAPPAQEHTPPASDASDEVNKQLALRSATPVARGGIHTPASSPAKRDGQQHVTRIVTSNYPLKKEDVGRLRRLGVHVVERMEEADVLVTSKLSRSPKMLYAIAKGTITIVQPSWIEACLADESVAPVDAYGLRDTQGEESYGVKLADVLQRRSIYPNGLYDGHSFWLARGVDDAGSFKTLILAAGGKVLPSAKRDDDLLVSDPDHYHYIVDENHKAEWKHLVGQLTQHGTPLRLYKRELISSSIFAQQYRWDHEYVDLEQHTNAPITPKSKQPRTSLSHTSAKRTRTSRPTM